MQKTCKNVKCGKKFESKLSGSKYCCLDCSAEGRRESYKHKGLQDVTRDFDSASWQFKRLIVLKEQENKCNRCDVQEWMGELLTLEVDHIDGDRSNNCRENLEALCPNCHSLTDTWRGRNKSDNRHVSVSDSELVEAIQSTASFRQALIKVGMAPKGANYSRVKRLHFLYCSGNEKEVVDIPKKVRKLPEGLNLRTTMEVFDSVGSLLEALNCTKRALRTAIEEQGLEAEYQHWILQNCGRVLQEKSDSEIVALYEKYGNYQKVGRLLGVTGNAVRRRLKRIENK